MFTSWLVQLEQEILQNQQNIFLKNLKLVKPNCSVATINILDRQYITALRYGKYVNANSSKLVEEQHKLSWAVLSFFQVNMFRSLEVGCETKGMHYRFYIYKARRVQSFKKMNSIMDPVVVRHSLYIHTKYIY